MSNPAPADGGRFEAAYRAGVTEEVAPPTAEGEGLRELRCARRRPNRPRCAAAS